MVYHVESFLCTLGVWCLPHTCFLYLSFLNAHKKQVEARHNIYNRIFILLITMDTIGTLIQTDTSNICLEKKCMPIYFIFFWFCIFLSEQEF